VTTTLQEMVSSGELLQLVVSDQTGSDQSYFALPESLELLNKPLARSKLKILSPFDNLLIQRKRIKALFDFDYLVECYVPAAKRQYGYFSLPILWDGKLVARMDCKMDKKSATLDIHHLALEASFEKSLSKSISKAEAFSFALDKELQSFLAFHGGDGYQVHRTSPTNFMQVFKSVS